MKTPEPDVNRLTRRLEALAGIGALEGGGVTRLTLTEEDRRGRDLFASWIRELSMELRVDEVGNMYGIREGRESLPPIVIGSHLDTVRSGGTLDGSLGVLAGLEVLETLIQRGVQTRRPIVVANFTNEEGVRYTPDMLGSLVAAGGMPLEDAHSIVDEDGVPLSSALERIGYLGTMPCGSLRPHAYVELHIEQGPVLEHDGVSVGAVEHLLGIAWRELTITGQANHAGTTPIPLRHDAGLVAAHINVFMRELAVEIDGRATCGSFRLEPDVINVIPRQARMTVDLRHRDNDVLSQSEERLDQYLGQLAREHGVELRSTSLARFEPVSFDEGIVKTIESQAQSRGHSVMRMTSGAGHDAQMMARICPSAMIFVPSKDGISHNPAEFTEEKDILAGLEVLNGTVLELAET